MHDRFLKIFYLSLSFFVFLLYSASCNAAALTNTFSIGKPSSAVGFESVVADSQGNIYTADHLKLFKFDKNGTFIKMIDFYQSYSNLVMDLSIDANNNLYIAGLNQVFKFSSDLIFLSQFGSAGFADGQFSATALAIDSQGNIYVGDNNSHRIQKFNSNGQFLLKWGTYGTSNSMFLNIRTISIDRNGNVVVLSGDSDSSKIQIFNNSGSLIDSIDNYQDPSKSYPEQLGANGAVAAPNGTIIAINSNHFMKFSSNGTFFEWGLPVPDVGCCFSGKSYAGKNGLFYVPHIDALYVYTWNLDSDQPTNLKPKGDDFSGDGKPDILLRNKVTGENAVWLMNGAAKTSGTSLQTLTDTNWEFVGIGDFNGDGKPDILLRNKVTGQNALWYMNGVTKITGAYLDTIADTSWKITGVGDLDSNGSPDILWSNISTGQNRIWYMMGATKSRSEALPPVADKNWAMVGVGDFNGDGVPDILWNHRISGQNYVWYMNEAKRTGGAYLPPIANLNWEVVAVDDFNSDGKPDILWRNKATGQNYLWYMNGVTKIGGEYLPTLSATNWQIVNH